MRKGYELWLDESGKFENERELRKKGWNPSLIGGFLVEKEALEKINFNAMIDANRNHAMDLSDEDKKEYILPLLEHMGKYGAREVFFENAEYQEERSNRQLYLKIMAEGLLQLLQALNAEHESVELDVIIAQRQDMSAASGQRRIEDVEYIRELKQCIRRKKKEHKIFLDEDSELNFKVKVANNEVKLQLADFACNTRLTRNCRAFLEVQDRVAALYAKAWIFSLSEISSVNFIRRSLVQGDIADAIMELYTTKDELNRSEIQEMIMNRIKNTSHRLFRVQLEQCVAEITAYAKQEDDYERGEALLIKLGEELVPLLEEHIGFYGFQFYFHLLICLADMYLKEGDVRAAREALAECNIVRNRLIALGGLENPLEIDYQYQKKEALLAVKEFDFERGCRLMEQVCKSYENIANAIDKNGNEYTSAIFGKSRSRSYGEALGMWIYAMLFLQRENPDSYEKMCELSDMAMQQYPPVEGELERHRQYRSRMEAEHGDYENALKWLLRSELYEEKELTEENIRDFLDRVAEAEDETGCLYHLMYYLLIMSAAKEAGNALADRMYKVLDKQKKLLVIAGLQIEKNTHAYQNEVNMDAVKKADTGIMYHPLEIICWKYASYLQMAGKRTEALKYYMRAQDICFKNKNYQSLYITGIGIMAEQTACLEEMENHDEAWKKYTETKEKIQQLYNLPMLPTLEKVYHLAEKPEPQPQLYSATKRFVKEMEELLNKAKVAEKRLDVDKLKSVSRKIGY